MGNLCSVQGAIDHWIYVKTGDRKGAGSDANVRIILYDDKGQMSPEIDLTCRFSNDFERGQTDTFQCPPVSNLGDIVQIELWRDNAGIKPDWFCDVIVVNDTRTEKCFYFPIQRWVRQEYHYKIPQYDTSLLANDPFPEQRKYELTEKRNVYEYGQDAPGLPVQIRKLPDDEQFSDEYKDLFTPQWDLEKQKIHLMATSMLTRLTTDQWKGLDDLTNIFYFSDTFPEPKCIKNWSHDNYFGAQRLVGTNPNQIRLCTELPENMGVTAEMLRPFLEGWTVKQIIIAKRLFIVDHKILKDLPTKDNRPLPAPMALFFLNGEKQLIPIAIQLYQDIEPNNPVFLCNDSPFTWIMAKIWFNLADASVHQSLTHLGYTHLMMESACIALHRALPQNHPIFRLLAPHFRFLLAINSRGINLLVSEDGWVDKTMTIGRSGMFELIRRGVLEWRLDHHGNLPKDLESRGVLDPKILPYYPYRDDGLLLFKAIENYVTKIIRQYYSNNDAVKADEELQSWAREMTLSVDKGGAGLRGVQGNGKFKHVDEVVAVCNSLMYVCTAGHGVSNFGQYDEYAFPPNYPAFLYGEPPMDKVPKTEEDVVNSLPNKAVTLDIMVVTRLLSNKTSNSLGEWELQYQYEPTALKAEKEFREELVTLSNTIKDRNMSRPEAYQYAFLDPEVVPNSISI